MYLRNEKNTSGKLYWDDLYNNLKDDDFKSKMRTNREIFDFLLNEIHDDIIMSATNLKPFPTASDR